jgi:hypothetical protein
VLTVHLDLSQKALCGNATYRLIVHVELESLGITSELAVVQ